MTPTVPAEAIEAIVGGYHGAPFDVLGLHPAGADGQAGFAVRAYLPHAARVEVVRDGQPPTPMERVHPGGFYEAVFPGEALAFPYRLQITTDTWQTYQAEDPYRFPPLLSEFDLFLIGEGTHLDLYKKMGAHPLEHAGVAGVGFAVWAPNAERVSVVGDFNQWDGRRHPMRPRGASGVWELFVPGLREGDLYKYEIKTRYQGYQVTKADPYAFGAELRPQTASMVVDLSGYPWGDADWLAGRQRANALDAPISIYEVHLGSWRRGEDNRYLTYRELADSLVAYCQEQGFTHLELLPITEHPFDGSWGYQTIGYFAPTSRFGRPADFMYFVDRCHQAGLGVILDWVPAHFPKDQHGLGFFDGTHLYEHADPRLGEHQEWGTYVFNFGRNEVRSFLLNSALFWLDQYHIDGLRVDAVASMIYLDYARKPGEWIPNKYGGRENLEAVDFLKTFNEVVHGAHPDVLTIAEESTSWPMVTRPVYLGGLGFDLKWNMGWMHDMLDYMAQDPVHRRYHHNHLTFSLLYAFSENFVLPFSHDEVVHLKRSMLAKMPGDYWQQFANLRALYGYMYGHPGKKLLFMGAELGQWNEWNYDRGLDWNLLDYASHRGVRDFLRDLNRLYQAEPALHEVEFDWAGFEWIDFRDVDHSTLSFVRRGRQPGEAIVVVANFTPVVRSGYRVGVPDGGYYREVLNSDSGHYWGSNVGNAGGLPSDPIPWQNQPHSVLLTLPPLAVIYLKRDLPAGDQAPAEPEQSEPTS
jgi:1,4-alpha-glucan branching enzyme